MGVQIPRPPPIMVPKILITTENLGLKPSKKGKVRDIFLNLDKLILIATDRISAFDVILPNPIPYKGIVLTQLTKFWNEYLKAIIETHIITFSLEGLPEEFKKYQDILELRTMVCKRAKVIPVECIVRGYLSGGGLKEYRKYGSICGVKLPSKLREADKLPEAIFTPSTKSDVGHDENISWEKIIDLLGRDTSETLKEKSLQLYDKARDYAEIKGIIIADTKFEFGIDEESGKIILIDEILTPDSSRFWPQDGYQPGKPQPSFDKQFVRDYLESINWDKQPPAPELPEVVINVTSKKYLRIYELLTGNSL